MTKMEIVKIEKSYKFDGYCFVTARNDYGKEYTYKRKAYERKTGKLAGKCYINLNTDVYSFEWNPLVKEIGQNFQYIGSYKDVEEAFKTEDKILEVEENKVPEVKVEVEDGIVKHYKFNIIKTCIDSKIPVYLAGPAGSGKNHTLEQIADEIGLEFYFTNSVQQEYKLTGFIDAGGNYHETEFYKAFKNGGLFFLDEMDASIPEVLVLLNAAIANGYFEFPNGKITAHEDFRVVAAGNTVGSGADEQYTGRMVLDQATLDRFAIIEFDYDPKIELKLANGNQELCTFIRSLRTAAQNQGVRATFSYRCITMVSKLEKAGMPINEIIKIAVVKGLDKDTINTLNPAGTTKYHTAFNLIKKAA